MTHSAVVAILVALLVLAACSPSSDEPDAIGSLPFDATADVVGTTDTTPDHWAPRDVEPERFQVRLFDTSFAIVPDFPVAMNGCGLTQFRVEWRSLGDPVSAGFTTFLDPGMAVDVSGEEPPTDRGDMILNGCEQPAFATQVDGAIVNVVVEVASLTPAVGS